MIITRQTDTIATNPVITVSTGGSRPLKAGMYVYGDGVEVGSKILSVNYSNDEVTLDKNAVSNKSGQLLYYVYQTVGSFHEMRCALVDAKEIVDVRGNQLFIADNTQAEETKDKYGSVKRRANSPTYAIKAFPVIYNPTDRQKSQSGLRGDQELIVYTALQDWLNIGLSFDDIEQERYKIMMNGKTHEIKEKSLASQYGDGFLYITLSLNVNVS